VSRQLALVVFVALLLSPRADAKERLPIPAGAEERKDIRFWMDGKDITQPKCGGCSRATWLHIGSYDLSLRAPAGARFERFLVGGEGRVDIVGISPNGRTVHATLRPGPVPGWHEVIALFRHKDRVLLSRKRFRVEDERRGQDCMPSPCSTPGKQEFGQHFAVPPPPRPLCRLHSQGPLRFTTVAGGGPVYGTWPQQLRFAVALPERVRGRLQPVGSDGGGPTVPTVPMVECTTGQLMMIDHAQTQTGTRDRFRVDVSSLAADAGGRLVAGKHSCKVTYKLLHNDRVRQRTGTLRFRIDADGNLYGPKPRCPKVKAPPPGAKKKLGFPGVAQPAERGLELR